MVDRATLDMLADRLEAALAANRVPGRVAGGTANARLIRFRITTPVGARVERIARLADTLAHAIGAPAVRISRENGMILIDVPRPDANGGGTLLLSELLRRSGNLPPLTAICGMATDQAGPAGFWLPSPVVVHALIAGQTGSGKSVLLRTILRSLAALAGPGKLQLLLIDPKGHSLAALAGLRHAAGHATGDAMIPALAWAVAEMERRSREQISRPALVVAIDELADLLAASPEAEPLLLRLSGRGREAGIHVLAATQRPSASLVGSDSRANFPLRIVGRVADAAEARLASGIRESGAERLAGRGDFLLVSGGATLRFQAAVDDLPEVVAPQLPQPPWAGPQPATTACNRPQPVATALPVSVFPVARESAPQPVVPVVAVADRLQPGAAPTPEQAEQMRRRYAETGSLSQVCREFYGYKAGDVFGYVKAAVEDTDA